MIVKSDGDIEMVKFTSVTKEFKNETHIALDWQWVLLCIHMAVVNRSKGKLVSLSEQQLVDFLAGSLADVNNS